MVTKRHSINQMKKKKSLVPSNEAYSSKASGLVSAPIGLINTQLKCGGQVTFQECLSADNWFEFSIYFSGLVH